MKSGLKTYFFISLKIIIISVIFVYGVSALAIFITDKANEQYLPHYIAQERGYSSPWYKNGLHIVDEGFIDDIEKIKKNNNSVVSIGSSMSRIPFRYEESSLPKDYNYYFLVCGNGCYRSDRIFTNMLKSENLLNKDLIVKYEISFSTFRRTEMTIAESSIDKWGAFSVDDDLEIRKNCVLLQPVFELNKLLLKIQNVGELYLTENNFCNNYFDYEAVAKSCGYEDYMYDYVTEDIKALADEAVCVVEISPLPEGLANTEYGKEFEKIVDDKLIPYLDNMNIDYLDLRKNFEESEFADGVHLSYNAGIEYTRILNEELGNIIEKRMK